MPRPRKKQPAKKQLPRKAAEAPSELGEILQFLQKSSSLGTQLDRAKIWENWPEIVGDPLWFHGKPMKFRRKKLYIEVDSPVWLHNYAYLKTDIIKHINDLAGYELVSELHLALEAEESGRDPQHGAE